jgi:UDP-glucose 6-dehydrogenase
MVTRIFPPSINVARQIVMEARSPKLVIEKSTFPARTRLQLRRELNVYSRNAGLTFRVVSNPKFLLATEGRT